MKFRALLAGLLATSMSFQAHAGNADYLGADLKQPMKLQTAIDSEVVPASCECQGNATCDKFDLGNPMQFAGCNNSNCDAASGCDSLGCKDKSLLGLGFILPSEGCYDDFISPMTNPAYFEDPVNSPKREAFSSITSCQFSLAILRVRFESTQCRCDFV